MKRWLLLLLLGAVLVPLGCAKQPKALTAEQMLAATETRSQRIVPIAQGVAAAYGDYLSFNISETEFAAQITALSAQYEQVRRDADQFRNTYVLAANAQSQSLGAALQDEAQAEAVLGELLQGSLPSGRAIARNQAYGFYANKSNQIVTLLKPLASEVAKRAAPSTAP